MKIIKEYCAISNTVVLRTDSYSRSIDAFIKLFEEAKKDFPNVDSKNVDIAHYGGERYRYTYGIEFQAPFVPSYNQYSFIDSLEFTL